MSSAPAPLTFNACAFDIAVTRRQDGDVAARELAVRHQRELGWDADKLWSHSINDKFQPRAASDLHGEG